MPTTMQDYVESQELVFPVAGERREPVGRVERTGGGASAVDPRRSRRSWSMRPSIVELAAAVCGKLWGCRLSGSATS